ncbi:MAG TPA: tetratricopeptide repeat protein, partial [Candidatus Xenobia bacterium]
MPATRTLADTLKEADALIEARNYQKALELLQESRPSTDDGAWHYAHGQSLLGLQRILEAAAAFRHSAELFEAAGNWEKRGLALEQAAGSYYSRRAWKDAVEQYRAAQAVYKAHDAKSLMGRALRGIGNVQVDSGDKANAVGTFREAQKLYREAGDQEGVALSIMNLASLIFEREGQAGAIKEYRQCVDQEGCNHHLALNNLGFLLTVDKEYDEALVYLQKADKDMAERGVNDEDGGLLQLNLGNVLALAGQPDQAEKHLQQALKHFANEGTGNRAIELVVLANQKMRDQEFDPTMATDDGLKEAVARLTLAAVRVAQGKTDQALQEAAKAVELDGQAAYVHAAAGWIHLANQDTEAATTAFRRAAGKEPNNAQLKKALELVNPFANSKVGRNDACPCGSGK